MKSIILERDREYPIYLQLADHLRERINRGDLSPNTPLPTEADFSRRLKITHVTLRKALKELQQEGYIYKIRGKGTFVADRKVIPDILEAGHIGKFIGLAAPESSEDGFCNIAVNGAIEALSSDPDIRPMRMISHSPASERACLKRNIHLLSGILYTHQRNAPEYYDNLKYYISHTKFPMAMASNAFPHHNLSIDTVLSDDAAGSRKIVKKFLSRGHRKIIFLTSEFNGSSLRQEGYETAMRAAGLTPQVKVMPKITAGNQQTLLAYNCILELFKKRKHPPTAILCLNDVTAIGAYQALRKLDIKLPEQVELIGYGDMFAHTPALRTLDLPISTIRVDYAEVGRRAAKLLLKRLDTPDRPIERILVPTEYIKKETTR